MNAVCECNIGRSESECYDAFLRLSGSKRVYLPVFVCVYISATL